MVDDEPALLQALRRMFAHDHDVVTFADPVEAKEWLLYGPQPDLVLCDMMMPVLGGSDLYQEVTRAHPGLAGRFVFVTGAAQRAGGRGLRCQHQARILAEKPLDRAGPAGPLPATSGAPAGSAERALTSLPDQPVVLDDRNLLPARPWSA